MPEYTFRCDKCHELSSLVCSIQSYDDEVKSIKCDHCKSKKLHREYFCDNVHGHVNEIRTLGQLAEANTKKYGSEVVEKMRLEHKTKREIGMKELPAGMNRIKKAEDFTNNYTKEDWKKKGKKK